MGSYGVPSDNLKIVAIVSGSATPLVLNDAEHLKREKRKNPNLDLLQILNKHQVRILVCGQALAKHKIDEAELNPFVGITTSALIAIPSYQMEGFVLMY